MKAQVIIPPGYKQVKRGKIKSGDKALHFSKLAGFHDFRPYWIDVCPHTDVGLSVTKYKTIIRKSK